VTPQPAPRGGRNRSKTTREEPSVGPKTPRSISPLRNVNEISLLPVYNVNLDREKRKLRKS
jgi:hypothetical protein